MSDQLQEQQQECPPPCCQPTDILCVSIPCPIQIVLLGIQLNLSLPCLRLSSGTPLTAEQVNQILGFLGNLLGNLGSTLPGAASQAKA